MPSSFIRAARSRPRRAAAVSLRLAQVLVLFLLCGVTAASAQSQIAIGGGIYVSFSQLTWLSDQSGQPPVAPSSHVGVATFSFDSTATQLVGSGNGAFVNLYSSSDGVTYNWEVQNLFFGFDTTDELVNAQPAVQFDLAVPNGTPLSSLSFQVSVTPAPVASPSEPTGSPAPTGQTGVTAQSGTASPPAAGEGTITKVALPLAGQPVYTAGVAAANYLVGGFNGGGSGALGAPAGLGAWGGGGQVAARPVAWAWVGQNLANLPVVNEDVMGCAPGGVARSIRYMLNIRNQGGPNAQTIYGGLYQSMGTNGNGTTGANMVNGKANWAAANGYRINTGWVNAAGAMNTIAAGGDVEINLCWNGGGHVAMIVQIVQYANGWYQITYVDQTPQGQNTNVNNVHTILVSPTGVVAGTGGAVGVCGFLGENM